MDRTIPLRWVALAAAALCFVTGPATAQQSPPMPQQEPATAGTWTGNLVGKIQAELKRHGYDMTFIGGHLNGETRDAIADWQRRHGQEPTGEPSDALLRELRASNERVSSNEWRSQSVASPYTTVLTDEFEDGEGFDATKWDTLAGVWRNDRGVLVTSIPIMLRIDRPVFQAISSPAEHPLAISPGPPTGLAAIASARPIDNAFRIAVVIGGRGVPPATINLGPYLGDDVSSGYRLVYDGEYDRPLKLISSDHGRITTVASTTPRGDLYDGDMHAIVWSRDPSGRMTIDIDGHAALEATDRSIASGFDGFSIVNAGGSWGIDSVVVQNAAPAAAGS